MRSISETLAGLDTGPLVALLDPSGPEHARAHRVIANFCAARESTGAVFHHFGSAGTAVSDCCWIYEKPGFGIPILSPQFLTELLLRKTATSCNLVRGFS
jgi:hypothetical protein